MKLTVKYFAILRDERGIDEEEVTLSVSTSAELYDQLKSEHGLSFCRSKLKVAINDEFSSWDTGLKDGDVVVFIPPVAGG